MPNKFRQFLCGGASSARTTWSNTCCSYHNTCLTPHMPVLTHGVCPHGILRDVALHCMSRKFAPYVSHFFMSRRWRTQLAPLLEAWDKLASSISSNSGVGGGSVGRRGSHGRRYSASSVAAGVEGEGRKLQPVDSFVAMENAAATSLCDLVTASLGAVKKVRSTISVHHA